MQSPCESGVPDSLCGQEYFVDVRGSWADWFDREETATQKKKKLLNGKVGRTPSLNTLMFNLKGY